MAKKSLDITKKICYTFPISEFFFWEDAKFHHQKEEEIRTYS